MPNAIASAGIPRAHASMALLAHQGGWDEVLFVVGPIAVILGVLAIARHRLGAVELGDPASDASDAVADDNARHQPSD